jgi:cytochrome c-type biogenesis protein CcsB
MMLMLTRLGTPFLVTVLVVAATVLAYGMNLVNRSPLVRALSSALFLASLGAMSWIIGDRYVEAGRPPFKTLFESLVLFGWSIAFVYVIVERFYRLALLGFLAVLFVLGIFGYAILKADVDIISLPAALQSGWFIPHVVVYFLGYAALFVGTAIAAIFLVKPQGTVTFTNLSGERTIEYGDLMHTVIRFGFALITVGLVIGAVWAKSAWGDYWVWDPKENWSLITWLIYIIYLHLRTTPGWSRKASAWILILGFAAVMFTYLGMNMLPTAEQSEHVYQ